MLGEYDGVNAQGVSAETITARCELMAATFAVLPDFFQSLGQQCSQPYERMMKIVGNRWPPLWHPTISFEEWSKNCAALHGRGGPLEGELHFEPILRAWAKRYHAESQPWVLDAAVEYLDYFRTDCYSPLDAAQIIRGRGAVETAKTVDFMFFAEGWRPLWHSWTKYRQRLQTEFENALAGYENELRSRLRNRKLTRKKWSPHHFEWFALCQFGDQTPAILAASLNEQGSDNTRITKALRQVGTLVGWQGPIRHLRSGK